ncbi:Sec-independent protein secretion pathway component [Methylacidiphilum infernorum V4]|uniref:Sec-independent protein secretion pathway component n=1 Tax=Methylacidiphilum infernorum (isolate V4) TaxID=481448 RepID=B3DYH3_METI4|nr:Sec-independent protein secretion pathway component [Methylacidiphilum infernorum V4]
MHLDYHRARNGFGSLWSFFFFSEQKNYQSWQGDWVKPWVNFIKRKKNSKKRLGRQARSKRRSLFPRVAHFPLLRERCLELPRKKNQARAVFNP